MPVQPCQQPARRAAMHHEPPPCWRAGCAAAGLHGRHGPTAPVQGGFTCEHARSLCTRQWMCLIYVVGVLAALRPHLPCAHGVRQVGQQQRRVPQRVHRLPGWGDAVRAVTEDHGLHRRASQERPRLERQQAQPIRCRALCMHRPSSVVTCSRRCRHPLEGPLYSWLDHARPSCHARACPCAQV